MSAYIVSTKTINYIVSNAVKNNVIEKEDANTIANILMRENVKSVNFRYNEKTETEKNFFEEMETSEKSTLMACKELKYQSCEHDSYELSIAHSILLQIIEAAETKVE